MKDPRRRSRYEPRFALTALPSLPTCSTSRRMKRHLAALIDGGQRHSTHPVTITAQPTDDRVRVDLRDRGRGPDIDPHAPLDLAWNLLARPEVMPLDVGDRLGIAFAHSLTCVAGGGLRFGRDQTSWTFAFERPARHSGTAAPGLAKIGGNHGHSSGIRSPPGVRGDSRGTVTPHIRNGGRRSVCADRSGGVFWLCRVRLWVQR